MSPDKSECSLFELPTMVKPEIKPNARFHIGISGGKDSTAVLLWMIHESGYERTMFDVTFCDTENEHQWTYEHVRFLSENVHPITTLHPAKGFFALALHKRRFPSTKARFCTEHLKIHPSQDRIQWLRLKGFDPIAVSGVRADESEERKTLPEWDYSGNLLCVQWRPLIHWTLHDVLAIHHRHGVPLNPLYAIGAKRVGCWPCIMSRKEEIRTIALRFPERIDEIRKAEEQFEKTYGRYSSFFASKTIPERFRTKPFQLGDGTWIKVATIDDVVRWSMTGDKAQGHYTDSEPKEPVNCNSGYCE